MKILSIFFFGLLSLLLVTCSVSANNILILENGEKQFQGLEKDGEVYIPFSYLSDKYNIYGENKDDTFYLSHSNRNLTPFEPYQPQGSYLNFQEKQIQLRSTIVMDSNGVPQAKYKWGLEYNPTTIAQYALQLFGQTLDSSGLALIPNSADWVLYSGKLNSTNVTNVYDEGLKKEVKRFESLDLTHGYSLFDKGLLLPVLKSNIVSWKFKPTKNFRFYVHVNTSHGIRYITYYDGNDGNDTPTVNGNYIYIPIKSQPHSWSTIVRNFEKDLHIADNSLEIGSVVNFSVRGNISLSDIKIYNQEDFSSFYTQNDWLADNQDYRGGWPYNFDFLFFADRVETLQSGWYSAIAQGTAISALTRAYQISNNKKYIESAKSGIHLYKTPVAEGGILRYWQENKDFPFYEEYPTTPASHVLNGYQFSLLGAYDLWQATGIEEYKLVYKNGIKTLTEIMPLYDTGHRTNYDLTHFTAQSYPNHASWHYHTLHIDMMKAINHIEQVNPFMDTIERWEGYLKGNNVSRD